jgi:hypothetical protein
LQDGNSLQYHPKKKKVKKDSNLLLWSNNSIYMQSMPVKQVFKHQPEHFYSFQTEGFVHK